MTYKFKIGDLVRMLKRKARDPCARGVITARRCDAWISPGGWVGPYYEIRYLDPRINTACWWSEPDLEVIQDPNSIMKEML